jgi:hypothetical protein
MSLSARARTRACLAAGLALTTGVVAGCKSDQLLSFNDPDVLNIGDYQTPDGAEPLRLGVISTFNGAFDGSDGFVVLGGTMTDEMLASDTFDQRLTTNARKTDDQNASTNGLFSSLQRARTQAEYAIATISATRPEPASDIGELYMYLGYSEDFLAEAFCSGAPFSSEDGVTQTFGQPLTTEQIFNLAVVHFDSALAMAGSSTRVKYGAAIGKGRALLNLGKFAEAAAAVKDVPQSYSLLAEHSTGTGSNGIWSATTNGQSRYRLMSNEGINGLPFLSQTTTQEPRIKWAASTRTGFSSQFTNQPNQTKFGRYDASIISNGIEGKLIGIEAEAQAKTQAAYDKVYADLNALRASGPPVVPAMTSGAPTTFDATINLIYRERAYWMWLTGHRLGDLRRLVRIYGRNSETVFPTGDLTPPLIGTYGDQTSFVLPFDEKNNPNFQGCLPGA